MIYFFFAHVGSSESSPAVPVRDKRPTSPSDDQASKRLREELTDNNNYYEGIASLRI